VDDPSPAGFADGLRRAMALRPDRQAIRANAARFSRERFMTDFQAAIDDAVQQKREKTARW
jgi:hypothetical protein